VQFSAVQYSTVQCSTVQYSTVQYSTVQYSAVPDSSSAVRPYACLVSLKNASLASVGISSSTILVEGTVELRSEGVENQCWQWQHDGYKKYCKMCCNYWSTGSLSWSCFVYLLVGVF
jgi:hypothetical protein